METENLAITWERTLKIWWSFIWRCTVFTAVFGTIFYLLMIASYGLDSTMSAVLAYSVVIPVSVIMFRKVLQMRFKEFSIHLVPKGDPMPLIEELAELRREKRKLQNILSNISPDVLLVVSPDRTILMCNNSVPRMFGYERDEIIGQKTDLLYFDRRSNPAHQGEIYEILEKEGYHIGLATGKKKNNEIIPLEIITGKLKNHSGAVLLLRDITERKRIEEELKTHHDYLEDLVRAHTDELEMAINITLPEVIEPQGPSERRKMPNEELS